MTVTPPDLSTPPGPAGPPPVPPRTPSRAGLSYRQIVALTGPAYVGISFAARLATAMLYLGLLMYVGQRTGSFATAGAMVSVLGLGGVVAAPLVGRAADRWGHRRPGLVLAVAQTAMVIALVVAVETGTGDPFVLLPLAALTGMVNPQIGSLSRSRWSILSTATPTTGSAPEGAAGPHASYRSRVITTAMALEAVLDEVSFVLGPIAAGLLVGLVHPAGALVVAAGLGLVSQLAFALHRTAAPPGLTGAANRPAARLALGSLAPLALGCLSVGLVFGTTQTGIAAHYERLGMTAFTGIVYAGVGVGSALAGGLTPRLPARFAPAWRPLVSAVILVPAAALLIIAELPVATALVCFVVGVCVAPILVTAYALAERTADLRAMATTMSVLAMATTLGVSSGAAVTGWVVDTQPTTVGLALPAAAGLLALVAGVWIAARHRHDGVSRRPLP